MLVKKLIRKHRAAKNKTNYDPKIKISTVASEIIQTKRDIKRKKING